MKSQPDKKGRLKYTSRCISVHLYSMKRRHCHTMGTSVELVLNLAWLTISVGLGAAFLLSRSRRKGSPVKCTYGRSTAWIAYLLLVAFLLPAISMTDDLMAMTAPADGEQVVRRYEATTVGHFPVVLHVANFLGVSSEVPAPAFVTVGTVVLPTIPTTYLIFSKLKSSRAPPVAG